MQRSTSRSARQTGILPQEISSMNAEPCRSWPGLVQQPVQIVASLRSHDLTLFVRPLWLGIITFVKLGKLEHMP
jgi:hypothetical protein